MKKILLLFLFIPLLSAAQEINDLKLVKNFESSSISQTKKFLTLGYDPKDYLYSGTNSNRIPLNKGDFENKKVLFYWSTSCHFCKKELKELKEIIKKKPEWTSQILLAMRVDYKRKEAFIKKEGNEYVLYKGDREIMRSPMQMVFISEQFGKDISKPGNPSAYFYGPNNEIILEKEAYFASKEKMTPSINQQFITYTLQNY